MTTESEAVEGAGEPRWFAVVTAISKVLGIVGGAAVTVMAGQIVVDTLMRFLFNQPAANTIDFVSYWWMPLMAFLGFAAAQSERGHILVGLLTDGLKGRAAAINKIVTLVLVVLILAVLAKYAWDGAARAFDIRQTATGGTSVPIWPVKIAGAVGWSAFLLQAVAELVRAPVSWRPSTPSAEQVPATVEGEAL